MQPPVFSVAHFHDPDNQYRPLQIVHGPDNYLSDPDELTGTQSLDNFLERLARLGTARIAGPPPSRRMRRHSSSRTDPARFNLDLLIQERLNGYLACRFILNWSMPLLCMDTLSQASR